MKIFYVVICFAMFLCFQAFSYEDIYLIISDNINKHGLQVDVFNNEHDDARNFVHTDECVYVVISISKEAKSFENPVVLLVSKEFRIPLQILENVEDINPFLNKDTETPKGNKIVSFSLSQGLLEKSKVYISNANRNNINIGTYVIVLKEFLNTNPSKLNDSRPKQVIRNLMFKSEMRLPDGSTTFALVINGETSCFCKAGEYIGNYKIVGTIQKEESQNDVSSVLAVECDSQKIILPKGKVVDLVVSSKGKNKSGVQAHQNLEGKKQTELPSSQPSSESATADAEALASPEDATGKTEDKAEN